MSLLPLLLSLIGALELLAVKSRDLTD